MKRTTTMLTLALVASVAACGEDVTTSDEYLALELEVAALEQQVSDLSGASAAVTGEVPAEVAALLDEWWAANERADGSVVDLYLPSGYHLYGDRLIDLDELAAHLDPPGWTHEWISEPYLVVAEPDGRYVVTRGVRNASAIEVAESALTFEILTSPDGELQIAQTTWLYVH